MTREANSSETNRVLTEDEQDSLTQLIGVANSYLIDKHYSRQVAIDALSIASVLVDESDPDSYGIAPGNVPKEALPENYDTEAEQI